jgi:hypothetical protein
MFCKDCGAPIANGSKFCNMCGKPQEPGGRVSAPKQELCQISQGCRETRNNFLTGTTRYEVWFEARMGTAVIAKSEMIPNVPGSWTLGPYVTGELDNKLRQQVVATLLTDGWRASSYDGAGRVTAMEREVG